jgi:hypothetical protein
MLQNIGKNRAPWSSVDRWAWNQIVVVRSLCSPDIVEKNSAIYIEADTTKFDVYLNARFSGLS